MIEMRNHSNKPAPAKIRFLKPAAHTQKLGCAKASAHFIQVHGILLELPALLLIGRSASLKCLQCLAVKDISRILFNGFSDLFHRHKLISKAEIS